MCADVLSQTPAQRNASIIHEGMERPARVKRHVRTQTDGSDGGGRYGTSTVLMGLGGPSQVTMETKDQ